MGKRRFAQVSTSEDEEEPKQERRGKKKVLRHDDDDDDEEEEVVRSRGPSKRRNGGGGGGGEEKERGVGGGGEEEADDEPQAIPIGDPIRVSGKGKKKKKHYASFEYEGNVFELEDPVLLTPESEEEKPYVAIIKDIADSGHGLIVTGQWFYRPEEAAKKGGGTWQARDTRELFYSFHLDDVPAESVMHKCVVHFIPLDKKLPLRSQHPGFIVQKVYDTVEKKLWKLTDKDYEDGKQHEINLLVDKTLERLGAFEDAEPEDASGDHHDRSTSKWNLRRKNMLPIDTSRVEGAPTKSDHLIRPETPGSCTGDVSEYHTILAKHNALTGDSYRDKWLEKLLQGIQQVCSSQNALVENKEKSSSVAADHKANDDNSTITALESKDKSSDAAEKCCWPDSAVVAITALEKVSHESLGSDFQKYNQKMRQLVFNLKHNELLATRLLNKELDPAVILNMSPNELKDGLTAEEKTTKEPEEPARMQMTDAICTRCAEKKVGVADIIQAGGHGDRYQLECITCGYMWYAPRDAISSLTIDTPNVAGNVGTAPWATDKFENVEKKLVSPRENEKPAADTFEKSTAVIMPVLETQKSFNKSKADDPVGR